MIEKVKMAIGRFLFHRKLVRNKIINFNKFFSKSRDCLIILPEKDDNFKDAFFVVNYLSEKGINITLFTVDFKLNLLPEGKKFKILSYEKKDKNWFNLPNTDIVTKIKEYEYDLILDLNRESDLFYSYIVNCARSKYKVGFEKENADLYYNFLVANSKINSEISYKNLLNSLLMF